MRPWPDPVDPVESYWSDQPRLPDDLDPDAPLDVLGALDALRHEAGVAAEMAERLIDAIDRLRIAVAKARTDARRGENA